MAGLSFAFAGNRPARLHFSWPSVRSPTGQQCNPRYRWIPAPSPILPRQVGGRFVVPLPPFPGFLPPQNVRAGGAGGAWRPASLQAAALATPWGQASQATAVLHPAFRAAARQPATLGSACASRLPPRCSIGTIRRCAGLAQVRKVLETASTRIATASVGSGCGECCMGGVLCRARGVAASLRRPKENGRPEGRPLVQQVLRDA